MLVYYIVPLLKLTETYFFLNTSEHQNVIFFFNDVAIAVMK